MSYVLVAATGSDFDRDAVREALSLLGTGHRYLFLAVHQGEVPTVLAGDGLAPLPVPDDAWVEQERRADDLARRQLQHLSDLCPNAGIRVESGDPGERICAVAADEGVDLVVVGHHNVGTLRRILGGSVSEDVAHHAPCPVLLVRPRHS
jgi:nucleotide-binding universal stress UspA family protein